MRSVNCSKVRGSVVIFNIGIRFRFRSGMMRFVIHRLEITLFFNYVIIQFTLNTSFKYRALKLKRTDLNALKNEKNVYINTI